MRRRAAVAIQLKKGCNGRPGGGNGITSGPHLARLVA